MRLIIQDMTPKVAAKGSARLQRRRPERAARSNLSTLSGLPQILERFGVPLQPILATAGLSREDLDDPEHSASFVDFDRLIGLCARRTKCAHFGLLLGQHVNLQTFGVAGRVARNAPSVGTALMELASYFVLHDSGGTINVSIHEGSVTFSYGIHVPGLRHLDQIYDLAVAAMANVMRQICGPNWRADTVLLPRMRPDDIRPYREHFAAPLRFDSILAGIVFPERLLSQRISDADLYLHSMLIDRATVALAQADPMEHGEVRRAIRLLLTHGQCSRGEVARQLGLHERTLGRRLQATGTTFQRLLDDTRAEIARQLLRDTRVPVARIATALGYGDPTVFTRAFTRWTGRTPSQFRADLVSDSPGES